MNFLNCKISPRDINFLANINAHPGYYLLRIEEDNKNYGNIGPVHQIRYSLMHVFQGANSLMATTDGVFVWDLPGTMTITGYHDIGLDDEIIKICK